MLRPLLTSGMSLSLLLAAYAEPPTADCALPGQALSQGIFDLHEMDMHLHAGMERPVALDAWIDLAVDDGRRVAVLLDHLELYRKTPDEYLAWRADGGFEASYPVGVEGHQALFADFDAAAQRRKVKLPPFLGQVLSKDSGSLRCLEAPRTMPGKESRSWVRNGNVIPRSSRQMWHWKR